jgi:tetratricopeptide (TPR) repeat protein
LLAAGRQREGREVALRTAESLRRHGNPDAAVSLLLAAASCERKRTWSLRLAEEMSSLHEQAGDHGEGIACLEPVLRGDLGPLAKRDAIRIRRRLGVHYHRAGSPEKALKLFREVLRLADSERDVEDLIFVGSELAELNTLRGEYVEAEEACRGALELLSKARRSSEEFRSRMEVTLRASLGHLELRRMALGKAKEEFEAAAKLARSFGTTAMQALIWLTPGSRSS